MAPKRRRTLVPAAAGALSAAAAAALLLGGGLRPWLRPGAAAAASVVVAPQPAVATLPPRDLARSHRAYGWPLRPFDRAHVVRGGFGDPRFGAHQRNFHFGVDLPAPGMTPVYAVAPGTAFLAPDRVAILRDANGPAASGFSYWHVLPAVREHAFVRLHQLLGWVKPLWGHLHFAELERNDWVNPLRPGALTPAPPPFRPELGAVAIQPAAGPHCAGCVAVVVSADARPPIPPPAPWQHAIVAPTLIRWRLLRGSTPLTGWLTAVDFRGFLPPNSLYRDVYAAGTRPTLATGPGRYVFYLARDLDADALPRGRYGVDVEAFGTRGAEAATVATVVLGGRSARAYETR